MTDDHADIKKDSAERNEAPTDGRPPDRCIVNSKTGMVAIGNVTVILGDPSSDSTQGSQETDIIDKIQVSEALDWSEGNEENALGPGEVDKDVAAGETDAQSLLIDQTGQQQEGRV
ncbi:hypothetical protein NDU88_010496 [Pleurodeles waltl]|uniref:Uncharacterized protein n=1 Tax=Pleurodeles waltl TaxID=8319 RepID=A0AAV7PZ19_PLEWA|nr:hypothetical protein NDU88_010496 [Pleurodeles waltl]